MSELTADEAAEKLLIARSEIEAVLGSLQKTPLTSLELLRKLDAVAKAWGWTCGFNYTPDSLTVVFHRLYDPPRS